MIAVSATPKRPTKVRYVVLMLATMVAILLYLDRICLGFAERYIKDDLDLTDDQMAVVMASFFWAYAVGQLPCGWLSDRFGARLTLSIYLAGWSAFTGWLGLATGLVWLVVLRFGCGLFQAGAYPACAGVIRRWMPFGRRGFASSIISIGGRIGGALAPLATAYLIVAFVPVSESSRLAPGDLLSGANLVDRLTAPASRSAQLLADSLISRLPRGHADFLRYLQTSDPTTRFLLLYWALAGSTMDSELVAAANQLLDQATVADDLDPTDFELSAASFRTSVDQRSTEQIERDNRLLFEAAYPTAIRKVYRAGWRPVMMLYGAIGIVVAAIFWFFFRESPRGHPACNAAEVAIIDGDKPPTTVGADQTLAFHYLLISPSLWWISTVQFLSNFAWVFLITWLPRFLQEVHSVPVITRGWMTSLPIMIGMLGMFVGGWLTDAMVRRIGRRWGRSLPLGLSRFVVAGAFLLLMTLSSPWAATFAFCLVALATDLGTPSVWAYSLDTGGKHVGAILGWSNMFGNLGAAVSPWILNRIILSNGWNAMFLTCAVALVLAGICALGVDATKPIVPEKA